MIDLRVIAAVGIGAAIGGIVRLLVTQLVVARAGAGFGFYATLFINVSGSFLIGVVIEMAQTRANVSAALALFSRDRHSRRLHDVLDVLVRSAGARDRRVRDHVGDVRGGQRRPRYRRRVGGIVTARALAP